MEFGEAIAQSPDPALELDDATLLDELSRIEWWPMTVEEANEIQKDRLLALTHASAYDQNIIASFMAKTEPYTSQIRELRKRMTGEPGLYKEPPPQESLHPTGRLDFAGDRRWKGDLQARIRLVEIEAWASAVRSARAGGDGWTLSGPPIDEANGE